MNRQARHFGRGAVGGIALILVSCGPTRTIGDGTGVAPEEPTAAPPPSTAEGLPPIPTSDGVLSIQVVHPPAGMIRPAVDSVFVYGSVGTGRASLSINGYPVDVAPNGAFLAYLPRPGDDRFRFSAAADGRVTEATQSYSPRPTDVRPRPLPETIAYDVPISARVHVAADTVATGSDAAIGRPSPTGTYRWFLPRGARLVLTGERGEMVRARLDGSTEAWFPRDALITDGNGARSARPSITTMTTSGGERTTEVRVPVAGAPFRAELTDTVLQVTLHGVGSEYVRVEPADGVVSLIESYPSTPDATTLRIFPVRSIWGYRAWYDDSGALVLAVRGPPAIDPADPLRGVRVLVDPGHPPGGAMGPTGLEEAEANLAIAERLADQLLRRGADVLLTRTTDVEVPLEERPELAVRWDADILVSVHNNAFPEGVNPFLRNGTSTYYFHELSADLAEALNQEIVATTGIRDLGSIRGNLALVRPSWMPAALTESLFMPMPRQEAALRDPAFLERLAAAHVRGIERFLLARTGDHGYRD